MRLRGQAATPRRAAGHMRKEAHARASGARRVRRCGGHAAVGGADDAAIEDRDPRRGALVEEVSVRGTLLAATRLSMAC